MRKYVFAVAQSSSKRGDIPGNVDNHIRHAEIAVKHGAEFIVFPELSLTGYEPDLALSHALKPSDEVLQPLQKVSDRQGIVILAGAPYLSEEGLHIAAFAYTPNQKPQVYTKHHLHGGEEQYFVPGPKGLQLKISGEQVSPAICADITHPEHPEKAARNGASVYAAGVFITPTGIEAESGMMQGYAEQYVMTVLMSNYASSSGGYETGGRSAAWDHKGNQICVAPAQGEAVLMVTRNGNEYRGKVLTI